MAPTNVRTLHWVMKVADRTAEVQFLHDNLLMHALRHEEFAEGCTAACNGPYDGRWSKTMIGYGPEDSHCVLELTYTYAVKHYQPANDLAYIKVKSRSAFKTLWDKGLGQDLDLNVREIRSPAGHTFRVVNDDPNPDVGPLASLALNVTSLVQAEAFWIDTLGFLEVDRGHGFVVLTTGPSAATLRLRELPPGQQLRRGTGYGRIAFSCPTEQLLPLQDEVKERGTGTVQTPLVSLPTPSKATVQVVILADPDGHEVCFVGDEAFRDLSRVDESAPQKLAEAITKDSSGEWFEKQEARKAAAAAAKAAPAAVAAPAAAKSAHAAAPVNSQQQQQKLPQAQAQQQQKTGTLYSPAKAAAAVPATQVAGGGKGKA